MNALGTEINFQGANSTAIVSLQLFKLTAELRPNRQSRVPFVDNPQRGREFGRQNCLPPLASYPNVPTSSADLQPTFWTNPHPTISQAQRFVPTRNASASNSCQSHRPYGFLPLPLSLEEPRHSEPNSLSARRVAARRFLHFLHSYVKLSIY